MDWWGRQGGEKGKENREKSGKERESKGKGRGKGGKYTGIRKIRGREKDRGQGRKSEGDREGTEDSSHFLVQSDANAQEIAFKPPHPKGS